MEEIEVEEEKEEEEVRPEVGHKVLQHVHCLVCDSQGLASH